MEYLHTLDIHMYEDCIFKSNSSIALSPVAEILGTYDTEHRHMHVCIGIDFCIFKSNPFIALSPVAEIPFFFSFFLSALIHVKISFSFCCCARIYSIIGR
jgi:hypothetical protein